MGMPPSTNPQEYSTPANSADAMRGIIAHAALNRRSIRKYRDTPLPDHDIREMLRLAARAPSAWNVQPWRFIVVRDLAIREKVRSAAYGQPQVLVAPAVVVLYSDMADALANFSDRINPAITESSRAKLLARIDSEFGKMTPEARDHWGLAQSNIVLGYLLLIAEAFGISTSPMLGFDPKAVRALFSLPDHAQIAVLIALGKAGEEGNQPYRLDIDRLVTWS
jgi:nitroreductase